MFRFTQEPSSGNQSQCLAKITVILPLCLSICANFYGGIFRPVVCVCVYVCVCVCVCVVHRAGRYSCTVNHAHAKQVRICRHNNDNAHNDKHSGTIPVILARQ
jgi:hypothetical protein